MIGRGIVVRVVVLVVAAATFVGLGGAAVAAAAPFAGDWDFQILCDGAPTQSPDLDGDWVAWAQPKVEGAAPAVVLQNIESGETRTVSGLECAYLDLCGDRLVFTGSDGESSALYLYTISTGETVKVTEPSEGVPARPVIAGRYLVWEEADYPGGDYYANRFLTYDTMTGVTRVVAETQAAYGGLHHVRASDEWLVFASGQPGETLPTTWVTRQDSGDIQALPGVVDLRALDGKYVYHVVSDELHRLDLSAGTDEIVVTGYDFQSVRADGSRLAWATWRAGSAWIVYHDMESGTTVEIPVPGTFVGGLKLSDDLLVWLGDSAPAQGGVVSYLFAYDHTSHRSTRLAPLYRYDEWWSNDGDSVLFLERRYSSGGKVRLVLASKTTPEREAFLDVPGTYPYSTATMGLLATGVAGGYPIRDSGFAFRPHFLLTRAQFAKMLAEALDVPVSEDQVASFTDLGPDDPGNLFPHDYIAALAERGIINGTAPGRFSPYESLTRRQMFTLVVRATDALYPGLLKPGSLYPEWLPHTADDLAQRTIPVNGLADGLIGYSWSGGWDEWAPATRGEAAQVLWNLMELIAWRD